MTSVHNLIIGKLYVDVHGKSMVTNINTGDYCEIDWKEKGWGGKNANMVFGAVKSSEGNLGFKI